MKKNYEIIGGYMVKDKTDKEEILDVLINVMSQNAQVVDYKFLKSLSAAELIEKLKNAGKSSYNRIVYEYSLDGTMTVHKAEISDDNRTLKFCGKTFIIETKQNFLNNLAEREAEDNSISDAERAIFNEIQGV